MKHITEKEHKELNETMVWRVEHDFDWVTVMTRRAGCISENPIIIHDNQITLCLKTIKHLGLKIVEEES